MSKHNYSQYAKPTNKKPNPNYVPKPSVKEEMTATKAEPAEIKMESIVKPDEPVVLMAPIEVVNEPVDTVTLPDTVKGIVSNCARLNVRAYPSLDAEVICILDVMSEVQVDPAKSTFDWLGICTASGIEGYCMRKFVDAQL